MRDHQIHDRLLFWVLGERNQDNWLVLSPHKANFKGAAVIQFIHIVQEDPTVGHGDAVQIVLEGYSLPELASFFAKSNIWIFSGINELLVKGEVDAFHRWVLGKEFSYLLSKF